MCSLLYSFLIIALTFDTILGYQMGGAPGFEQSKQLEQMMLAMKDKCDKYGGRDAFENIMVGQQQLQECIMTNIQADNFLHEMQASSQHKFKDGLFGKYCKKSPQVMNCIKAYTEKIKQCVEPKDRGNIGLLINIMDNVSEHLCYKNGERMATFLAEGGLDCFVQKMTDIQKCGNDTISKRHPGGVQDPRIPLLAFDDTKDCDDFDDFQYCVVSKMRRCERSAPANIINDVFNVIRDTMPCKKPRANDSSLPLGSSIIVFLSSLLLMRI